MLTCGLHVHVAVGGLERTLAVYNALRTYLPEIVALGANAPFYRGEDSGLATVRPTLNAFKPRSGLPPAFASWRELADFTRWVEGGGEAPDGTHHWWDIRLNPRHATLEVRAADTQTRVEDAAALAAIIQTLVVELAARYDAGEDLPVARRERIAENMWLAIRDGVGGWLLDPESGKRMRTIERLQTLTDALRGAARSVGCERELLHAAALAEAGGGATRQRRAYEEGGRRALLSGLAHATAGPGVELASAGPRPALGVPVSRRPRAARDRALRSHGLGTVTP
jgi:carboxylate-amine ligase